MPKGSKELTQARREQLLKLLSMNNYDMEANSRPELLASFKRAYGKSIENIELILAKICPDMSSSDIKCIYVCEDKTTT